jgi:hypothetical protein
VTCQGRENHSFGTTPPPPCYEFMEYRGVKYAVVKDERLGLWRWSVLVGRPEVLRVGEAEHRADVQVQFVIDRALRWRRWFEVGTAVERN